MQNVSFAAKSKLSIQNYHFSYLTKSIKKKKMIETTYIIEHIKTDISILKHDPVEKFP